MTLPSTEKLHPDAARLTQGDLAASARALIEGQIAAATAVRNAEDNIVRGAGAMAKTIRAEGVLHFVAAGSSGLMAAADAQELGGTFSISPAQLRIHMAGGLPTGVEMPGGAEDATEGLELALGGLQTKDTVIAVSASGSTPYTVSAMDIALAKGATVISIANNAGSPLLTGADIPILLTTPPELISGSTRMGAGTAQKIALNMLSSLMAVELGHVHGGMMVNLRADNDKLRGRAAGIVARIADVDTKTAQHALDIAHGDVKPAILIAAQDLSLAQADARLQATNGVLTAALAKD
ncbi:N-acetylmuramic acid 6-phosphate etherase [Ruegeria denitrificans]|uniref:N-acetylmuramic acid 6-phosphate etherase n=1 Tax=Ruegeria denitrificans TaxID=1715692 RepID=A0A0N7M8A0_9RHOB|nr:N-acetylmuramic acid 6-phosphate etherase [Ruegeria denitrificans]CUJ85340.1 N-acetylmuramic acid 6-phosphate etherase [Ruegeria denitrificans]